MSSNGKIQISSGAICRTAYLFLLLPWAIFLIGYIRVLWAVPLLLLAGAGGWFLFRETDAEEKLCWSRNTLLLVIGIAFLAAFLAGQGGWFPQKYDHHWRNAIFSDLILGPWPVTYGEPFPGKLVYYFLYWMIPAAAGKLFLPMGAEWAVEAGHCLLFLWTGGFLSVTFLSVLSLFRITDGRKTLLFLLLFLLFSGMDYPGFVIRYRKLFDPEVQLEWWNVCQYSSFYTQLAWVFNQALPAWLCTVLCLRKESLSSRGAALSLCFAFSPLPSLGLGGVMGCLTVSELRDAWKKGQAGAYLKKLFSPASVLIFLSAVPVSMLFFRSNGTVDHAAGGGLAKLLVTDAGSFRDWGLFVLMEFGVLSCLIRPRKRDVLWIVTLLILLILPLFQIVSLDFCMRVSIPPLLMLFCYLVRFLREGPAGKNRRRLVYLILLAGAVTPLSELASSLRELGKKPCRADGIRSFGNRFDTAFAMTQDRDNFVSRTASDSLFFRYFAKENREITDSLDNRKIRRIFQGKVPEAVVRIGKRLRLCRFENWFFVAGPEEDVKRVAVFFYLEDRGKNYFGKHTGKQICSALGEKTLLCLPVNRLPEIGYLFLTVSGRELTMEEAGRFCRTLPERPFLVPEEGVIRLNLEKYSSDLKSPLSHGILRRQFQKSEKGIKKSR